MTNHHPAERDTLLPAKLKPTGRLVAIAIAIALLFAVVPAFAHPGDHEHCQPTVTSSQHCH